MPGFCPSAVCNANSRRPPPREARRAFVGGPTSRFSTSLIAQFVVGSLPTGFPCGSSHKGGMAMRKRLALSSGLFAIVLASMIAAPARAYDEGAVAGGGTIDGKVVFNGAVPTRKIIPNKDVEVCGDPREEALIEVGP